MTCFGLYTCGTCFSELFGRLARALTKAFADEGSNGTHVRGSRRAVAIDRILFRTCVARDWSIAVIGRPPGIGAFQFVVLASLRVSQLARGCPPRVDGAHRNAVVAQLEVSQGKVVQAAAAPRVRDAVISI